MYYLAPDTIAQANNNIKTLDAKAGGLFCVLSCLSEKIEENKSYTIDGGNLRRQLSFVFDKVPKEGFDNFKSSYIIFAVDWHSRFFKKYIKNQIDLLSCAVFFLRRAAFEQKLTSEELINLFVKQYNLEELKGAWFLQTSSLQLEYNENKVEDNQAEFYKKMNYNSDFKSLLFNGVIQKSAADLKAAGQIQTLYSGSGVQSCFLLSDEPLDQYYIMRNSDQENDTEDSAVENEYQRAAQIIKDHIKETGFEIPSTKDEINAAREEFISRYDYRKLASVSGTELLNSVFYTTGDNTDALCCWIEMNKECREFFGSISGGSAYKFGLFQKKDTGVWTTGSPQKPVELSEEEAVDRGTEIVKALIRGAETIDNATLSTLADYEKLDDDLKEAVGEQFYNWAWFHTFVCSPYVRSAAVTESF